MISVGFATTLVRGQLADGTYGGGYSYSGTDRKLFTVKLLWSDSGKLQTSIDTVYVTAQQSNQNVDGQQYDTLYISKDQSIYNDNKFYKYTG